MEAIVNAKKFKEQIGALQGIFARKETIPVLGKIKIDAGTRGDLVMTATDLDVSLIIEQEVDILQPGSILLSGKKLYDIAATLPGGEPVHLKLDDKGERVEFRAGRFRSKLSGTQSEQFPEVSRVKGEAVKLSATVFYEGLRRTAFAVIDDAKRFTINGSLLLIENSVLKMVSTDGHRLCYFRIGIAGGGSANDLRCLIPIKAVRELVRILAEEIRANSKAEVKIRKGGQLEFEIGNKLMTAREVTGAFPNWEMVLPKNFEYFAELKVSDLKDALTRVGVMADDVHRRVEFVFYPNRVSLETKSPETGSSTEEVPCTFQKLEQSSNGENSESSDAGWKIAFNTKYLGDFFSIQSAKRDDQRIVWKFTGVTGQTEMSYEGEERMFSYILVPLKT